MALRGSFPERYKDVIALYMSGKSSIQELRKADFVQWPPPGLDIYEGPDIPVKLKSIFSSFMGWKSVLPEFSNVFIMAALPFYMKLIYGTHLALKTFGKLKNLGGFVEPDKAPNTIYINDYLRLFTRSQAGRRVLSHTVNHEKKHIVQTRDRAVSLSSSLTGTRIPMESYVDFPDDPNKAALLKYLVREAEVQARMDTVIVGAYHQFGRVPLNKMELLACLHSQGLIMPKNYKTVYAGILTGL